MRAGQRVCESLIKPEEEREKEKYGRVRKNWKLWSVTVLWFAEIILFSFHALYLNIFTSKVQLPADLHPALIYKLFGEKILRVEVNRKQLENKPESHVS